MKKLVDLICFIVFMWGCFELALVAGSWKADDSTYVIERVERVYTRTSLRHIGCVSNGCWECYGEPQKITAYGINKAIWPHRCTGCGATNTIYDARWPKIESKWEVVK